ncbi:winged helix-turn-helix transcriptional regulator [Streptomyces monticola]|uniref:Winged helix-turn-helix transcriptional regulator n=1 Tax=Streptomyces monticola TaxID=2666263 RepID=A0ABW2JY60_9ACTN
MKRTSLAHWPCSIARTMDLLGDWWTPLVLREAFYGIKRFDDFQRSLGLARNTLTARLQRLVEEGMLERVPYQRRPERFEYQLTDKGREFFPVLAAMMAWGDRWLTGTAGAPVTLRHTECGHETRAAVVCEHCREPLTADSVHSEMGPGFPAKLAERADVRERFGPAAGDSRRP